MRKLVSVLALLLITIAGWAQQRMITGTVKDQNNLPVAGATVAIKGTNVATQTNNSGSFSIAATNANDIVVVSFIGFESQELTVDASNNVAVSLKPGNGTLSDVVVTGYTSQRKRDVTGAVAVVDLAPVKNNSSGNTMQALQGRVAGLYIEKDGSPNGSNGRILIRGANTLGNNDPLYVIDGIPTTRPEVFRGKLWL